MRLQEFEELVKDLFGEISNKEEYGFSVRNGKDINRIGYSTNLTPEVVQEGIQQKVDLIVTHHDAWEFLFGMKEYCVKQLAENGIAHFFIHLPLDGADFGTGASLAKALGGRITAKTNLIEGYYCGVIAEFDDIELARFAASVERVLNEPVRVWQNNNHPIKKVGIVTGGGNMTTEVRELVERGCDTYITGEKSLYTIQYAKFTGINLIVGSHTFTEIWGVESLALKIKEAFSDVEIVRLNEAHSE